MFSAFGGQIEQRLRQKLDDLLGKRDDEDDDAYNDKDWL